MGMTVTIKLFATLGLKIEDYDHKHGLMRHVPKGTTPADLLQELQIPLSHVGLISSNNKILEPDMPLSNGMSVNFFSLISGG